jgi:hypothetical protein
MTFHARTATTLAVLAAPVCAACTVLQPTPPPRAHPATSPSPQAAASAPPGLVALLPVSPAQLQAAAALAARFTTAYATVRPGQSPGAWLARLRPMATTQLAAALARTAATPALWQHHPATAGQAAAERIRDLAPASVIFTVRLRQTTTSTGRGTLTLGYAVTVTRRTGGGWAVYDIEPATAGNTG